MIFARSSFSKDVGINFRPNSLLATMKQGSLKLRMIRATNDRRHRFSEVSRTIVPREARADIPRDITGGGYCCFDPCTAKQWGELLRVVALFAVGGVAALKSPNDAGSVRLIGKDSLNRVSLFHT